MAIEQPPKVNLKDPNWRFPILEWLVEGKLPLTRRRLGASRGEPRRSSSSMASSTSKGLLVYSCSASLETRAASCYKRYTPTPAVIMQAREHLSGRLFDKGSTSPRQWQTPKKSNGAAMGASSTHDKPTSRRRHF
jgi:hypothetical protein